MSDFALLAANWLIKTGSLQVTILPPETVTAGAQWRVDGGTWRDSGYTEAGLSVGTHTVDYKDIAGWDTPADEDVQISDGLTTKTSGTYTQQTGSLQVTILPPEAAAAGAQWRVDGGGKSLSRKVPTDYGNDVANWQAAAPSPGSANP